MSLFLRLRQRLRREASRLLARQQVLVELERPIVSFTFDDFPRSALWAGGAVLEQHGVAGTYYAAFGLMGTRSPTGEMFTEKDVAEILRRGHELGCHTFDHCHSWDTAASEFEASILRNQQASCEVASGLSFRSLSYPISGPRPANKRCTSRYYSCARGGGQTFNRGWTDAYLLRAYFIEQARDGIHDIRLVIENCVLQRGWLIFATHGVCGAPDRYSCTPELFDEVVRFVGESGAEVLPVSSAFERVSRRPSRAARC